MEDILDSFAICHIWGHKCLRSSPFEPLWQYMPLWETDVKDKVVWKTTQIKDMIFYTIMQHIWVNFMLTQSAFKGSNTSNVTWRMLIGFMFRDSTYKLINLLPKKLIHIFICFISEELLQVSCFAIKENQSKRFFLLFKKRWCKPWPLSQEPRQKWQNWNMKWIIAICYTSTAVYSGKYIL